LRLRWTDRFTRRAIIAYVAAGVSLVTFVLGLKTNDEALIMLFAASALATLILAFAAILALLAGGWRAAGGRSGYSPACPQRWAFPGSSAA
jgi:hypothetical protein